MIDNGNVVEFEAGFGRVHPHKVIAGDLYIDGKMNEFYNTSFYKNTARNGYGSIYSYYNGANDGGILVYPIVNIYFSSFMDNKEIISYSKDLTEWSARPGNGYEIPHIKYIGCIIQDDLSYDYFKKLCQRI